MNANTDSDDSFENGVVVKSPKKGLSNGIVNDPDFLEKLSKIPLPVEGEDDSSQEPVDCLGEAYSQSIRPFIDLIDNLRRFGLQQDISLPNVVVVGDQSSGKSSIIEAISGIQLPRGKGIVTRCPLELQLKRVPRDKDWVAKLSYETAQGVQKIEINEPSDVEDYIVEAQNEMCGTSKGVSRKLITLRIESPATTAPDLTLIDLPGIARIAVQGQPHDICQQITNIIRDHIERENTVIMCVVSANVDAAVNESIKMAKQFDPNGKRTFGIITKPDTADDANKDEVLALLNNEKIHLARGFNMVKCRSQKDLDDKVTLEQSVENEKMFFETDRHYRVANKSQLGTMNLAKKITEVLVEVIQQTLPALREKINESLEAAQAKLCSLPPGIPETSQGKLVFLIGIISKMNIEIESCLVKGKSSTSLDNHFYTWRNLFNGLKTRMEKIKNNAMGSTFSENKMRDEIAKKRGNEISGFLNFELYESIITSHVVRYKPEAHLLLKQMNENCHKMIDNIIHEYFLNTPAIESKMKLIILEELENANKKTTDKIEVIFEEEKLVFTLDTVIEREIDEMKREQEEEEAAMKNNNKNQYRERKNYSEESLKKNAKRMLTMMECYLKIVHSRLADLIPMSIRQCLHVELSRSLSNRFVELAMTPGICDKLTDVKTNEQRNTLTDKIERLQNARNELVKFNI